MPAMTDRPHDNDGVTEHKCGQQLVCYVGRSYQQVPRKTFKKQRLAVAESGARLLSVRDAGTGVYTQQRCSEQRHRRKRYTEMYIYIRIYVYICIYIYIYICMYIVVRVEICQGREMAPREVEIEI